MNGNAELSQPKTDITAEMVDKHINQRENYFI
jgi:hypothetical protein